MVGAPRCRAYIRPGACAIPGGTSVESFEGLRWEAFSAAFRKYVDKTGRANIMSDVLWSHTKGLLRGMERKHHQALSPETDQDPLEVQAVVQVQCETECERTCVVYMDALMASVGERVYVYAWMSGSLRVLGLQWH